MLHTRSHNETKTLFILSPTSQQQSLWGFKKRVFFFTFSPCDICLIRPVETRNFASIPTYLKDNHDWKNVKCEFIALFYVSSKSRQCVFVCGVGWFKSQEQDSWWLKSSRGVDELGRLRWICFYCQICDRAQSSSEGMFWTSSHLVAIFLFLISGRQHIKQFFFFSFYDLDTISTVEC